MAEELSPISAAKPPVSNPVSTLKLKPVIRKPLAAAADAKTVIRPSLRSSAAPGLKPAAPAAPAPAPAAPAAPAVDHLKNVTQKLKGITQEIPAQAILHKTGIIADQALTEAQKQASKSRTARISLSDAIGVAPVAEQKPIKTIRIKRPVDLQNPSPGASTTVAPVATLAEPAPAPVEAKPAPAAPAEPAPADAPTVVAQQQITQRKTLKISRPGSGVKPLGLKKPGLAPAKPAAAAKPAEGEAVADIPEIADIPEMPAVAAPAASTDGNPADVPVAVAMLGLVAQIAACAAIGFLGWCLYQDTQLPMFCGGLMP